MLPERFRLLPLLIFVAMLTFSVRLAEVITGISHFSGMAMAEEKQEPAAEEKPAEHKEDDKAEQKSAEAPKEEDESAEHAQADSEKTDKKETDVKEGKAEEVNGTEAKVPEWRDAGDSDVDLTGVKMDLMEDMAKRRDKLDAQEKNLKAREALLKATEQEIDRKYQELNKLKTEIEGLLGKQTEEEEKQIGSLVKIYEGMKPKDAARIFDTLDIDILVAVVSKMSERKIAPILGLMDPERAKTLTIMLAQQKKLPTLVQ